MAGSIIVFTNASIGFTGGWKSTVTGAGSFSKRDCKKMHVLPPTWADIAFCLNCFSTVYQAKSSIPSDT